MSISGFRRKRLGGLIFALGILGLSAAAFFFIQNSSVSSGGSIAAVKVLWLLTVIVYWYVLAIFWAFDRKVSAKTRGACRILAVNMLLRGVVELWMMYVSNKWLHNYGIAHDIASMVLCVVLAIHLRKDQVWAPLYFAYCAVLFTIEAYFAAYLRQVSAADGSVFFLAPSDAHNQIMIATAAAVLMSAIVGYALIRKWTDATASFTSTEHR